MTLETPAEPLADNYHAQREQLYRWTRLRDRLAMERDRLTSEIAKLHHRLEALEQLHARTPTRWHLAERAASWRPR